MYVMVIVCAYACTCREELTQCRQQQLKLEDDMEHTEEKITQKKGVGSRYCTRICPGFTLLLWNQMF